MIDWLVSLILGAIQGVTEFLPVSSDGHLTVANFLFERYTGHSRTPRENIFFFVVLHLGTLAAILVHYRREIVAGARGLLGSTAAAEPYHRGGVVRVGLLAGLATAVLIPDKLFFLDYIERAFDSPMMVGVGFLITAAVLAVTASSLAGGDKGPSETTLMDALIVGLAQAIAPLPGVSRSGLTIAAALALGFRRTWAVQFSLILAVPAVLGAAVFEIAEVDLATLTADRIAQTAAATVVAGLVGYAAIVWLVRVVHSGRLWYFSVYLAILGLAVIAGFASAGGPKDGRTTPSLDRPSRAEPEGSPDRRGPEPGRRALDRPVIP